MKTRASRTLRSSLTDEELIAAFLAAKGARLMMAPEMAAELLRDAGHQVTILETIEGVQSQGNLRKRRVPILDGKEVPLAALYASVNELRAKAGLRPVEFSEKVKA